MSSLKGNMVSDSRGRVRLGMPVLRAVRSDQSLEKGSELSVIYARPQGRDVLYAVGGCRFRMMGMWIDL